MNSQFGTQLPRRKEQSLKCGITQIFGGGPVRPGNGERVQKAFVRVANPNPRLRREPIESSQPLRGRFESRIIEDFGLLRLAFDAACQLPLVTVPLPDSLVALAFGEQAEPDAVIAQFKNEPRNRGGGPKKPEFWAGRFPFQGRGVSPSPPAIATVRCRSKAEARHSLSVRRRSPPAIG